MKFNNPYLFLIILLFVFVGLISLKSIKHFNDKHTSKTSQFHLQCYFTDWSYSRKSIGKFTVDDIPKEYCTHLLYAFAFYDPKENSLMPADKSVDIEFYKKFTNWKNKGKVVILSVGGWTDSTVKYHEMLKNDSIRKMFAKNSVEYAIKHNFQGIDLDLEYPTAWQGVRSTNWTSDKENFVKLLKDIRSELNRLEKRKREKLYLSIAAGAGKGIMKQGYDVKNITEVVDWISLMTYDMHGSYEHKTGLLAPFTAQPGDSSSATNVKEVVEGWIANGAKPEKLILGIPFYGRTFKLTSSNNCIGAPATSTDYRSRYTAGKGTLPYYEIVENVKNNNWTSKRISQVGSYAYKDDLWVGYDGLEDVTLKAEYIKKMNLLGAMIWTLENNCFQKDGPCGKRYELLNAISTVLKYKKLQ